MTDDGKHRNGLAIIGGAVFIGAMFLTRNTCFLGSLFVAIVIAVAVIPNIIKCPVCGGALNNPKITTIEGKRQRVCETCNDEHRKNRSRNALAR